MVISSLSERPCPQQQEVVKTQLFPVNHRSSWVSLQVYGRSYIPFQLSSVFLPLICLNHLSDPSTVEGSILAICKNSESSRLKTIPVGCESSSTLL
ncbi:unnamed protein product [Fusarium graminearum]|uniref:Chromosome 4, complete genome n=1 Tax=Gibberella zeae (strain ATCC MYA-4620 / CBS 123657 / FGSC 9075 / NRRL 31084 / PH-1) TaxID=229533 RepID=A0A098DQZ5_GIBZE|nr:unnamed protein product [Fusarium graminearum]CZS72267.1 unnamed protein product [Fusarium graminearum]